MSGAIWAALAVIVALLAGVHIGRRTVPAITWLDIQIAERKRQVEARCRGQQ